MTSSCVNHFANQAVFCDSFRPLGDSLIHSSNNLLSSRTLGVTFSWGMVFALGDSFMMRQSRSSPVFYLLLSLSVSTSRRGPSRLRVWKVESWDLCFWEEEALPVRGNGKETPREGRCLSGHQISRVYPQQSSGLCQSQERPH